ncbi:hypothetical protein E2N92_02100 [Methanofollis formosanus]|uniref:Uncharacterized protein n=1 Tax=Methanofollis formosanus TaxID=299308 RepID=A0A8G0ZYT9_9EURY|nr:hypothetical protein [Methanofollis formosanus]QYZ78307.1 hypothetical protein E2N92_02100 [Methanofollis formosanus]
MTDYQELAEIADRLLEEADEDDERLVRLLDGLSEDLRLELLTSDLLNAYQAYLYFFREEPGGELQAERLMLTPASETLRGVFFDEADIFELVFLVGKDGAVVEVTDGEQTYERFTGKGARDRAVDYVYEKLA